MKPSCAILLAAFAIGSLAGCGAKHTDVSAPQAAPHHEHVPPHHGTPVVLGHEEYHLELVADPAAGVLRAYVLDGEMENFIRVAAESFEVKTKSSDGGRLLLFKAVASHATGETVGDTSMFEAQAGWIATNASFDAVLQDLSVRGGRYQNIPFNFPKGNDTD